jgi:hypothetical protein
MELLGDSMSMLRLAPDSVHGIPMTTCINVGLEVSSTSNLTLYTISKHNIVSP